MQFDGGDLVGRVVSNDGGGEVVIARRDEPVGILLRIGKQFCIAVGHEWLIDEGLVQFAGQDSPIGMSIPCYSFANYHGMEHQQ